MKPRKLIDTAPIPGQQDELQLYDCGDKFVIRLADGRGCELMSTRMHGSEDALGELPCRMLGQRPSPRVLIGGLGMGFTLAAALNELGDEAEVLVSELVPGVVRWNHGPMGEKAGYPVRDERVSIVEGDVVDLIQKCPGGFDAIMLDVDNGPAGLTQLENSRLYSEKGVRLCLRALKPEGILAVWSASRDERYSRRLRGLCRCVEERQVYAHGKKGTRHTIWLVKK